MASLELSHNVQLSKQIASNQCLDKEWQCLFNEHYCELQELSSAKLNKTEHKRILVKLISVQCICKPSCQLQLLI